MSASNTARAKLFCQVPLQVRSLKSPFGNWGRESKQVAVGHGKDVFKKEIDHTASRTPFPDPVSGGPEKEAQEFKDQMLESSWG